MESQLAAKQNELIGMLYDAILCPEGWQAWLDTLVAATGSRSGLLVLQNAENLDIGYTVQTGFDQSLRELYNRDYREHDVWMRGLSHMTRERSIPRARWCRSKHSTIRSFTTNSAGRSMWNTAPEPSSRPTAHGACVFRCNEPNPRVN
jgi:hypothetical protein